MCYEYKQLVTVKLVCTFVLQQRYFIGIFAFNVQYAVHQASLVVIVIRVKNVEDKQHVM